MKKIYEFIKNNYCIIIFFAACIVTLPIRLTGLEIPLSNEYYHFFRHTQTAMVVRDFFDNGWHPLSYSIPVRGKISHIIFEFPIYQSVVFFLMKIFGMSNIDVMGRIVNMASFYASAVILFFFVKYLTCNKGLSCTVAVVYVLSAFNLYWSKGCFIDYMSVMFGLLYIYMMYMFFKESKLYLFFMAFLFGTAAYVLKSTSMFPCIFFFAFIIIRECCFFDKGMGYIYSLRECFCKKKKDFVLLFILCIIPVLICAAWNQHADLMKNLSEYTMIFDSVHLKNWNFGTMEQKLSLQYWLVILDRFADFYGGYLVFVTLLLLYFLTTKRQYSYLLIYSFFAVQLTYFCLFNLYYVHNYYQMAVSPFIYIVYGVMLYELGSIAWKNYKGMIGYILLVVVLLIVQYSHNHDYIDGIKNISEVNMSIGKFVEKNTLLGERILIADEDWNSSTMYYSRRSGFMLRNGEEKLLNDANFLNMLYGHNYTTLVAHTTVVPKKIFSIFSSVVQYPFDMDIHYIQRDEILVYKFHKEKQDDKYEHIISVDAPEVYQLVDWNGKNFTIEHDYSEDLPIDIFAIDELGGKHKIRIVLLGGIKEIPINLQGLDEHITGIEVQMSGLKMKIKY